MFRGNNYHIQNRKFVILTTINGSVSETTDSVREQHSIKTYYFPIRVTSGTVLQTKHLVADTATVNRETSLYRHVAHDVPATYPGTA